MSGTDNLLYVKNLRVSFRTGKQSCFEAVKGISFTVPYNKTVALVGESGSGKSVSHGVAAFRQCGHQCRIRYPV